MKIISSNLWEEIFNSIPIQLVLEESSSTIFALRRIQNYERMIIGSVREKGDEWSNYAFLLSTSFTDKSIFMVAQILRN